MLKDKLKVEVVVALKNGDRRRVEVMRYLVALIDKRALQLPINKMTEAEEIQVLRKELKNKREAREIFSKAGRNDLVEQQDYEIGVVEGYLPLEMSEEEIEKIVDEVMAKKGSNLGMVMGEVMKMVAGRVEGEVVAKIVRQKISG
jgi:uncharacterized protein YqeY